MRHQRQYNNLKNKTEFLKFEKVQKEDDKTESVFYVLNKILKAVKIMGDPMLF